MRIGYLVSQYPAPSHTFIRREVASLRRQGLSISTFSIRPGDPLSVEDAEEALRTVPVLPARPAAVAIALVSAPFAHPVRFSRALRTSLALRRPGVAGLARSLAYLVEGLILARALERQGIDHLHSHFANAASHVGLAAARYLDIGWSVSLHGFADFESPLTPLLPAKIAQARFVATATRFGKDLAVSIGGPASAAKVHVIRCGIEVGRLPRPERREPGPGEPLQVLSVGRLSPEKGQVGLVEAFALATRSGLDARLVLVGGGPEEDRIRAAAKRLGVAGRVELRGPLPEADVLEAMARAHVFVLSSLSEGLPVVLMEALGLGLPVVAPAISGIPELVVHGESGLLFEAGRWDELGARLVELGRDPGARARMAAAGRERVLAEFDVDRATPPLAALFLAEALDGGAPGLPAANLRARG